MDLLQLTNIAIKAAYAAGEIIRQHMDDELVIERKTGQTSYAAEVVTDVDLQCDKIIREHLSPISKELDLAILSEETEDDGSRFEKDYFWCIDPLDGTLAFINKQPGFSVSIALIAKDGTPFIGVIYDPSSEIMYSAIKYQGVFKNGAPWEITKTNSYLTYVTDKKLSDTPRASEVKDILHKQAEQLGFEGFEEINGGGSAINGIRVLENGPACLFKFPKEEQGGGCLWDFAAVACFFQELGLPVTNYRGGKLDLNKRDGVFLNTDGVYLGNL